MKVAIVGSRTLSPSDELIARHLPAGTTTIVSGGAKGVDEAAARYAESHGLALIECLPNYDRHGGRAPLVRNQIIVDTAAHIIAFWDGKSTGTMHTVGLAKKAGKPVVVVRCQPERSANSMLGGADA
jgi:predicted Rossmann fold nucleotide-binding protein DprA/Smf involved in DNA uptake